MIGGYIGVVRYPYIIHNDRSIFMFMRCDNFARKKRLL